MRATLGKSLFPLIAKRIDSIPTLPLALARLLAATGTESHSTREVARLVEADPALTAKVLKIINSPFYGLRFKISTMSHAIAMLGLPALRNLASGIAPFPAESEKESALDKPRFWQHSLAVATAARSIAKEVCYDLPEEAYIGALLHDVGKLVLDLYAPEEYARHLEEPPDPEISITERERRHLAMDHCQMGALVAEQWNLPKILKDAIQFHHEPEERLKTFPRKHREMVGIVTAADRLCWAYGLGSTGDGKSPGDELRVYEDVCLSAEQVDRVLQDIGREFEWTAARFGFEMGPGDSFLPRLREENDRAVAELAELSPHPSLLSRLTAMGDAVRRSRMIQGVEDLIESSLRSIQQALSIDRVLFLQVDIDEERLRGKYLFDDTHIEVDVHDINLPLNPDGLLGAALRDGTAQRIDNWATDGDLLRYLGVVEAVAAPLIVNQQPLGIICADYFFRNREISDTDVTLLGLIGTDLSLSVENLVLSRQSSKLRSLAAKDELTGVNNRRNLMKLLQKEIDRAIRYSSPLSAVMVDIDHFKTVNDNYGHQVGDTILMEVSQLVAAASRDIDVIGRYGGEEFLVVLPETHVDEAIVYAERLRATVEHFGRERQKIYPKCRLTISIGVTSMGQERDDLEQIIQRVDRALYAAKERGRNRVCVD